VDRHLNLGSEFMHVVLAFVHSFPYHARLLMPWGGRPTVTPAGIIPWWDEKGTGGGDRFDESVLCHTVDDYYVMSCLVTSTYVCPRQYLTVLCWW